MNKFRSIRTKYTIIFVGALTAILLVMVLVMNFGLKPYVESRKKEEIIKTVDYIKSIPADSWASDESYEMMRISSQNNFGISVYGLYDNNPVQLFSTNFNLETSNRRFMEYMNKQNVNVDEIIEKNDEYVIYKIFDARMGADQIECMGHTDDTAYVITTSMNGITESVEIANTLLFWIALIGIGVTAVSILFITRRITKPILKLSKQSEQISNLDFSVQYEGEENDEIGILGDNMNKMSKHLEKTISELQSANKKLEEDIAEKEKVNKRQRDFIANVSHELKTPIALIGGYAEGLKDGIASDPDSAEYYIDVINDEAGKMDRIVKRLLNLDEIESGRMAPIIEEFDLVEVASGVINATSNIAKEKNIEIVTEFPESAIISSDSFMIEQVMVNYVNNAYNHVSENGKIIVSIANDGDGVTFAVRNTGKNIPEEDIDRIWDKFYKVDKAHTRSYGGSGIGLSIVKSISSVLGASCLARNTEDGVEFNFTI